MNCMKAWRLKRIYQESHSPVEGRVADEHLEHDGPNGPPVALHAVPEEGRGGGREEGGSRASRT